MTLVSIEHLNVSIGAAQVLHNVNLRVGRGEIVTIVGPNGSGKTTLLRSIIGATRITAGKVTTLPGLQIGYVPQKLQIDPTLPMTVRRFLGLPKNRGAAACQTALAQAGVPDLANRQMSTLSGGQFQRVLLSRALIDQPDILLLDEATQGLDQPGSAAFYRQIEAVRQTLNCAVLMISHELHVVMSASDRVICLNGHICCEGTPEIVASAPEYRALFGSGTMGAMALYRHHHDHGHDQTLDHDHNDCHQGKPETSQPPVAAPREDDNPPSHEADDRNPNYPADNQWADR